MAYTKITRQLDSRPLETINLEFDLPADLAAGSHTETLKAYDGAALVDTKVRNFTTAIIASYDTDYQNVLDAVTTNGDALPTTSQRTTDNQLLIDYKATGGWVKDDAFMKFEGAGFGTGLVGYRLMDWKRLIKMDAYGSLVWSDTGAKGNGANAYIDTKYIANDAGNKWTIDNAGLMLGIKTLPTANGYVMGYRSIGAIVTRIYVDVAAGQDDHFHVNDVGSRNNLIVGLNAAYLNATDTATITDDTILTPLTTLGVPDQELYLFAYRRDRIAQIFSDVEISFATFGADKRAEHAAIKALLE